jgi:CDP-diacylglycerol--serine O-phosphatidyltransferase
MVSFGVLPSLLLFSLWDSREWYVYLAFLPAVFSALRLAKFNIDERQGDTFYGIPTPANAMTVAAFPFILKDNAGLFSSQIVEIALGVYAVIISILMIADIPMMALKFKDFSWANNRAKFIFLILSSGLLIMTKLVAIPLILILYVGISLFSKT